MKDLVTINKNNESITSSRKVAEIFGMEHKHILEIIKKLDLPKNFSKSNFRPAYYTDEQGKKRLLLELTRNGFTLLAMGYTSKKAIKTRLKILEAFKEQDSKTLNNSNLNKEKSKAKNLVEPIDKLQAIVKMVLDLDREGLVEVFDLRYNKKEQNIDINLQLTK